MKIFGYTIKKEKVEHKPQVDLVRFGDAMLYASSSGASQVMAQLTPSRLTIREAAGLQEAVWDPSQTIKIASIRAQGVEYPDDADAYQDYLDAYRFVPWVARAIDIKNYYVWQAGYDLEGDEKAVKAADAKLAEIDADTILSQGSLWAAVFGNYYWRVEGQTLTPLSPVGMGVRRDEKGVVTVYTYKTPGKAETTYKSEEILHLKFNVEPWSIFGYGTSRRVLLSVKQILYMEKYLPEIARQRGDPWLKFTIRDAEGKMPLSEGEFTRVKALVQNRKPGENLFDDGTVEVAEIYQAAGVGGRQTLEGIMSSFRDNLVGGLGVPEIYLGYGGTTLKGTAEHQEIAFESEVRGIQRYLKRFQEQYLFPLLGIEGVKVMWRPLKPEDKAELSKQLMAEIEHGVMTPDYARQRLGYPTLGGEEGDMTGDVLINAALIPWISGKVEPTKP